MAFAESFSPHKAPKSRKAFNLDDNGSVTGVPGVLAKGHLQMTAKTGQDWKNAKNFYFSSPVRRLSALCPMLVIHALMRVHPGSTIRTSDMVELLNEEYGQIQWDAVSVGMILSELTEECLSWIEGDEYLESNKPFWRGRNGHGYYYMFGHHEWAWRWFSALLDELRPIAVQEMTDTHYRQVKGEFAKSNPSALYYAARTVKEKSHNLGGPQQLASVYSNWETF